MTKWVGTIAALLLVSASAATHAAQPQAPAVAGREDVVGVEAEDPAMVAAIDRARSELPSFLERLSRPQAGEEDFAVKFDLGGTSEFIWAGELRREDGVLTGTLSNDPVHQDYRQGQRVVIAQSAIIDWGYARRGIMQGNYTTRVLLGRIDAEQAAAIREAYGW